LTGICGILVHGIVLGRIIDEAAVITVVNIVEMVGVDIFVHFSHLIILVKINFE